MWLHSELNCQNSLQYPAKTLSKKPSVKESQSHTTQMLRTSKPFWTAASPIPRIWHLAGLKFEYDMKISVTYRSRKWNAMSNVLLTISVKINN